MNLDNEIWKGLEGGYRTPYDVSIPLAELEQTKQPERVKEILEEFWNELHHQGDVGIASYLAIPQLVRIAKQKSLTDSSLLALCAVIEQQRHLGENPELPNKFKTYYNAGLNELKELASGQLKNNLEEMDLLITLSAIATCNGQVKVGKAILEFEDQDILDEFLEQF